MKPITLTQYLIEQQRLGGHVTAELRLLIQTVAQACIAIGHAVNRGALAGVLGGAGSDNVQGEAQKKLDVISNDILIEANEWGGHLAAMVSEEMEHPHLMPAGYPTGPYLLLVDPLDGSSNIDVNVSIGTIFSVLPCPAAGAPVTEASFLQPGSNQVAAGFAVYGPSTMLVLTVGNGTVSFTLDRDMGTFVLTAPAVNISEDTGEFAINMSNQRHWTAPIRRYIDDCLAGKTGSRGKDFNMRWVASMVADVYRIISRGGIFMYPADQRYTEGRLRLMYEANPMAMVIEQAGGAATDGVRRILDIEPSALHQRIGVVLGSKNEVAQVAQYHQ